MPKAWDKGKKYVKRGNYCGWSVTIIHSLSHSTSLKKYYSYYSPVTMTATAAAMAFTETSPTVFYSFDFKSYDNPKRKLLQEPLPFQKFTNNRLKDLLRIQHSWQMPLQRIKYGSTAPFLLSTEFINSEMNSLSCPWLCPQCHSSWHTAGTKTGEHMEWTRGKEKKEREGETEHYFLF